MWWTNWHWDRALSESFDFTLSISYHRCSIFTHIIWEMDKGAICGPVPQSHSLSYPIVTTTTTTTIIIITNRKETIL
jgi:hypothetical protein